MTSDSGNDLQQVSRMRPSLRAIVAVDERNKVQCQQPGCGHSLYAAIHVVEEGGTLLVLGSRCFEKRYGDPNALGAANYGGGTGRKLTDEEREMLQRNTRALLARFAEQASAAARAHGARVEELARQQASRQNMDGPNLRPPLSASAGMGRRPARTHSPWPWQKAWTSVALFTSPAGEDWVRVQHQDGSQKLVPWPQFQGWETSLPAAVGVADPRLGAIAVNNIVEAIRILQGSGFRGPFPGAWQEVLPHQGAQTARRTPHSQRRP
jgi:hypothetical protein